MRLLITFLALLLVASIALSVAYEGLVRGGSAEAGLAGAGVAAFLVLLLGRIVNRISKPQAAGSVR